MTTEGPFFRHRVQYIIKTLFGIKNIFGKKRAKKYDNRRYSTSLKPFLGSKTFLAKKGKKYDNRRAIFWHKGVQYIIKTLFGIKNILAKKLTTEGPNRVRTGDLLICSQLLYH
jgi:hypothetical protein